MNHSKWKLLMMKKYVQIVLTSFGVTYFVLSKILDYNSENVLGLLLIALLITVITDKSIRKFGYDGQLLISTGVDDKKLFSLELDVDPSEIERMTSVAFKVTKEPEHSYEEVE